MHRSVSTALSYCYHVEPQCKDGGAVRAHECLSLQESTSAQGIHIEKSMHGASEGVSARPVWGPVR